MFKLKRLSKKGIPSALAKAERYRLLNEPKEARSICLDILEVDPKNQKALIMLLLAITDQFEEDMSGEVHQATDLLPRVRGKYEQVYYEGIVYERQGRATLSRGTPGSQAHAYEWFREAMIQFEKAERLRPPGNDDAILRWNTCARIIMEKKLTPTATERVEQPLE